MNKQLPELRKEFERTATGAPGLVVTSASIDEAQVHSGESVSLSDMKQLL